jgi:hypothetical protein
VKGASIWKLYYAGSIGGHAILGIPMVRRLKKARPVKAWPFDTGWKAITEADLDGVEALAVEVKLGLTPAQPLPGEAKELAPVRALAERIAKLDETGKLGAAFAPPNGVSEAEVQAVEREEGWILNVERRSSSGLGVGGQPCGVGAADGLAHVVHQRSRRPLVGASGPDGKRSYQNGVGGGM